MCSICGWQRFLRLLNRLLADERYDGHQTVLEGIREDVMRSQHHRAWEAETVRRIVEKVENR